MNQSRENINNKLSPEQQEEQYEHTESLRRLKENPDVANIVERELNTLDQKREEKKEEAYEIGMRVNKGGDLLEVLQKKDEVLESYKAKEEAETLHDDKPTKTKSSTTELSATGNSVWKNIRRTVIMGLLGLGLTGTAKASNDSTGVTKMNNPESKVATAARMNTFHAENLKQPIEGIEGVMLTRDVYVPTKDTAKEVHFFSFDVDPNDPESIEKVKAAVKKLGYELGSDELLQSVAREHGTKLAKWINTGISLEKPFSTADDTRYRGERTFVENNTEEQEKVLLEEVVKLYPFVKNDTVKFKEFIHTAPFNEDTVVVASLFNLAKRHGLDEAKAKEFAEVVSEPLFQLKEIRNGGAHVAIAPENQAYHTIFPKFSSEFGKAEVIGPGGKLDPSQYNVIAETIKTDVKKSTDSKTVNYADGLAKK